MARKETVFKMSIDDSNSIKTLKDLDKNTTRLKKSMDDLADSGDELSDEFKSVNTAYEETIESQKRLMGDMEHLGDDILVEVSGSISKMEDRLYELALAGDTTSKEFVDLQRKTAQYKAVIIETDRSVDALAEQGRGLSSALAIGSGAVAGFQAFTGVTALLGDENEELLQTIVKLQAAEGVLNSIEVIKQQLQANSIKLTQARTAVQKAYNVAIGNGTKATKLFRGALLATGIGAIIVGIGLLIENWDKLTASLGGASKAQKLNNEVSQAAISSYSDEASQVDRLKLKLNDETLSREEKVKAVKDLQEEYPDLLSNIDAEKDSIGQINEKLKSNISLLRIQAEIKAAEDLRSEKFSENLQEQIDIQTGQNLDYWTALTSTGIPSEEKLKKAAADASAEKISGTNEEIKVIDDLISKKEKEKTLIEEQGQLQFLFNKRQLKLMNKTPKPKGGGGGKSAAQTRIEEETKAALELSLLQEELRRMTLDALELEELAIADKFDRLAERAGNNAATLKQINEQQESELTALFQKRKDAEQAIQDGIDQREIDRKNAFLLELEQLEDKATRTREENEINAITDKYFNLRTLAEQYGEETKLIDEQERAELEAIEKEHSDRLVAIKKQETDERIALQNKYLENAAGGLNALSGLNELVSGIAMDQAEGDAKKKEEIARKQFNVNKALQLGLAAIDGFKAINASLTTSPLTILGVPNPGALGALITTASISAINIAKIAATKYKGSTSKPSVSGISSSGSAGSGAGSFSISDDTSSTQTNLNPDGTPSGSTQPTQVVVSEIEISNVQNGIEAIETKSTF